MFYIDITLSACPEWAILTSHTFPNSNLSLRKRWIFLNRIKGNSIEKKYQKNYISNFRYTLIDTSSILRIHESYQQNKVHKAEIKNNNKNIERKNILFSLFLFHVSNPSMNDYLLHTEWRTSVENRTLSTIHSFQMSHLRNQYT